MNLKLLLCGSLFVTLNCHAAELDFIAGKNFTNNANTPVTIQINPNSITHNLTPSLENSILNQSEDIDKSLLTINNINPSNHAFGRIEYTLTDASGYQLTIVYGIGINQQSQSNISTGFWSHAWLPGGNDVSKQPFLQYHTVKINNNCTATSGVNDIGSACPGNQTTITID